MSFASATRRFNRQAFTHRVGSFPVTVDVDGDSADAAKSPTELKRVQDEHGAGWTQRAIAVFNFSARGSFVPDIGTEWTISKSPLAAEVGTVWRCFELRNANIATATDHRCVCFRLD